MKILKDFLIVALLGCLAFMTYIQEGDCVLLKQRTFYQSGGLWSIHNQLAKTEGGLSSMHERLTKIEGGLKVGCSLEEMKSCAAILSLKKLDKECPGDFHIFINGKELPQLPRDGGGSGVFISPTALLTAKHVVEGLVGDITITTASGEIYKSIEIIEDKDDDIALIIVDRPHDQWMTLDTKPVQFGDTLICIGNPFRAKANERLLVTWAKVADESCDNEFIYDGFCWHGDSGGPLIRNNKLVGITIARHIGGNYLGFAVPVDRIDQEILEQVL